MSDALRVWHRVTDRRDRSRVERLWDRAISRATTPAAREELQFLHDRMR